MTVQALTDLTFFSLGWCWTRNCVLLPSHLLDVQLSQTTRDKLGWCSFKVNWISDVIIIMYCSSSGSSCRVREAKKHEIYAAAFGGHLFMTYFDRARGAMAPSPSPHRVRYCVHNVPIYFHWIRQIQWHKCYIRKRLFEPTTSYVRDQDATTVLAGHR